MPARCLAPWTMNVGKCWSLPTGGFAEDLSEWRTLCCAHSLVQLQETVVSCRRRCLSNSDTGAARNGGQRRPWCCRASSRGCPSRHSQPPAKRQSMPRAHLSASPRHIGSLSCVLRPVLVEHYQESFSINVFAFLTSSPLRSFLPTHKSLAGSLRIFILAPVLLIDE